METNRDIFTGRFVGFLIDRINHLESQLAKATSSKYLPVSLDHLIEEYHVNVQVPGGEI